jgi:hypothetical protein
MSNEVAPFIADIKEIDEKLNYDPAQHIIRDEALYVAFMPYYIDPDTMNLTVVLKREIQPGAFPRTGRKMGLSTLNVELPIEKPMTIEEAFKELDLDIKMQNATPFGSVMTHPKDSSYAIEMVLVQTEPPEFLDEKRCIIKQEAGKYEIGSIPFDAMLGAIHDNFLQDMTTRLMLSELYIMAVEEANQQAQGGATQFSENTNSNNGMIGGGANHAEEFYENVTNDNMPKTSSVDDTVLQQNQQMDFGAIYAQK